MSKFSVLSGSLVLMVLSLACSAWVCYELFSGGYSGIAGATAGCALQIVAYGLSANMAASGKRHFLAFSFAGLIFGLSIALSYLTVSSLLQVNSKHLQAEEFKEEITARILEQKLLAAQLSLQAAEQGIPERYREQGKKFIEKSDQLNDEVLADLKDFTQGRLPAALPTYSAWQWLQTHPHLMGLLALAMALLFDLTPVISFFYLAQSKAANKYYFSDTKYKSVLDDLEPHVKAAIKEHRRNITGNGFRVAKTDSVESDQIEKAIRLFVDKELSPNFRDVCNYFSIGNKKAKLIFEAAMNKGALVKNGNSYEVNKDYKEAA